MLFCKHDHCTTAPLHHCTTAPLHHCNYSRNRVLGLLGVFVFYSLSISCKTCKAVYTPPFTYKTGTFKIERVSLDPRTLFRVDSEGDLYYCSKCLGSYSSSYNKPSSSQKFYLNSKPSASSRSSTKYFIFSKLSPEEKITEYKNLLAVCAYNMSPNSSSICIAPESAKTDSLFVIFLMEEREPILSTSKTFLTTISLYPAAFRVKKSDFSIMNFEMQKVEYTLKKISIRPYVYDKFVLNAFYDVGKGELKSYMSFGQLETKSGAVPQTNTCVAECHSMYMYSSENSRYFVSPSIIKIGEEYWTYVYGEALSGGSDLYQTYTHWDWVYSKIVGVNSFGRPKTELVHGLDSTKVGPSIDPRNFFGMQSVQHNGKTIVLIGMKTTGNEIKANNFPSKDLWVNEKYAPWGMDSPQFCISSWQDIDKATPSVKFPVDICTNNRLFTQLSEDYQCFFVVYKKDDLYYLIYLVTLSDTRSGTFKAIMGVATLSFDENNHARLGIKREFTNKNTESTFPGVQCVNPYTLQIGSHWLWFIYQDGTYFDRCYYIIIDADNIIKFAPTY